MEIIGTYHVPGTMLKTWVISLNSHYTPLWCRYYYSHFPVRNLRFMGMR